ncbi:MAG TPA: hypothetical protein ENH25_04820 [candidate division Zixibacteria bacterium]|nr:hypothetical protein [candidate division Zixibacteria bacterium]
MSLSAVLFLLFTIIILVSPRAQAGQLRLKKGDRVKVIDSINVSHKGALLLIDSNSVPLTAPVDENMAFTAQNIKKAYVWKSGRQNSITISYLLGVAGGFWRDIFVKRALKMIIHTGMISKKREQTRD